MTPRKAPCQMTERVYAGLVAFIEEHGYSPTTTELSDRLYLSRSAVWKRIALLGAAGRVTWEPRKPRTLRPLTGDER